MGSTYTIPQLLADRRLRKQLFVGVVIKIGIQFSGIDAIFYYSTLMFRHAKVADPQVRTRIRIALLGSLTQELPFGSKSIHADPTPAREQLGTPPALHPPRPPLRAPRPAEPPVPLTPPPSHPFSSFSSPPPFSRSST